MEILFRRFAEVISPESRGSLVIFRVAIVFLCREGLQKGCRCTRSRFLASLKGYRTGILRVRLFEQRRDYIRLR